MLFKILWQEIKKKPGQNESQGCAPDAGRPGSAGSDVQCWALSQPKMPNRLRTLEKTDFQKLGIETIV